MEISARHRDGIQRGFHLVANLLLGFVALVLVLAGTTALAGGGPGRFGKLGDFVALLIGASILFVTANRWKTRIAGFFGLPAVISAIGILVSGHMPAWPYTPVPWRERALVLAFAILLTALTFPSNDFRKPSDLLSRACLTVAVVTFFMAVVNGATNYGWLACCLALLTSVRIRHFIQIRHPHRLERSH